MKYFFSFVNIKKKIQNNKILDLPKTNNSKYLTISDGKYKLRILKK